MTKKKRPASKAKTRKAKKAKVSEVEKAMRSLPPAASDFKKVLNNEPGYTLG